MSEAPWPIRYPNLPAPEVELPPRTGEVSPSPVLTADPMNQPKTEGNPEGGVMGIPLASPYAFAPFDQAAQASL
jgi:hypothetical protein